MVHRNVKKTLDLLRVQVHGQNSVCSRRHQKVRDQFGGDGHARLVLPILSSIPIKRQHCGHASRAGPAQGIHHDEQFHQMVIAGRARGLDDKNVLPTHILLNFNECLSVRECAHRALAHVHSDGSGNGCRQRRIGCAAKEFHTSLRN